MSSTNLGWLYYKDYFYDLTYKDTSQDEHLIKEKLKTLLGIKPTIKEKEIFLGNINFEAKTSYPGLLIGIGNPHELPSIKGQAILGFSFDYTSGLPYIPASSLKGVLRSAFANKEYIKELLDIKDDIDIKELEKEIFEGQKDLFFDATVTNYGVNGLLSDDYITPHHKDELKEPVPLRFIKISPDVTFLFEFKLKDGLITKEDKAKLFASIIEDIGLGAKTNVGYGVLKGAVKSLDNFLEEEQKELEKQKEEQKLASLSPLEKKIAKLPEQNGSKTASFLQAVKDGEFDEEKCEALQKLKQMMIDQKEWLDDPKKASKNKKAKRTAQIIELLKECS